jgi:hypothetical protein
LRWRQPSWQSRAGWRNGASTESEFFGSFLGSFGGIDAWFKWQPDFVNNFTTYLTGAQGGQPGPVHDWIQFWINTA